MNAGRVVLTLSCGHEVNTRQDGRITRGDVFDCVVCEQPRDIEAVEA